MTDTSQQHRGINLFYLILAILFGLANLFAYAVWWPTEAPAPVSVVDAPTSITEHPEDPVVAIQSTITATSTLPTIQSTTSLFAMLKQEAGEATTTTPKKATTTTAVTIPKAVSTDRLSPTTPGGLVVRSVSYNQVIISWNPSKDNRGVAGYGIYQDSVLIGTTVKTIQGFIRLKPLTKYTFGVAAFDSAGNTSDINNILVTTTAKPVTAAVVAENTPAASTSTPTPSPLQTAPPATPTLCGNGTQDRGEECDDGNTSDNDMCTSQCKAARCTDGIINYILEQCDDGNEFGNDYCDNQCHNHVPTLPDPLLTTNPSPSPSPSPTASAPTVNVTANPTSVASGAKSTISWTSSNATSCSSTGGGGTGTTGSFLTAALTTNASYTVTCTGAGGTGSGSANVTVAGSAPAPTVNVTASPTTVASGGSATVSWTSSNATSCSSTGGGGTGTTGTFSTGALTTSTSYSVTCTGAGGNKTTSVSVTVTAGAPTTYTVNVTSAGNYDTTNLTLHTGDSIKFVYSGTISGEVVTRFTPTTVSSVTLDSEFHNRTRTFNAVGTWTFKAENKNGNTGTVIVQ